MRFNVPLLDPLTASVAVLLAPFAAAAPLEACPPAPPVCRAVTLTLAPPVELPLAVEVAMPPAPAVCPVPRAAPPRPPIEFWSIVIVLVPALLPLPPAV